MEFLIKVQNHQIQDLLSKGFKSSLKRWCINYEVSSLYKKGIKEKDTENSSYLFQESWNPLYAITHPWYRVDVILPNKKKKILTYQCIKLGLKIMQEDYEKSFESFIKEEHSLTEGDVFLQCALFGKVIY